jgi:hypothetical protein
MESDQQQPTPEPEPTGGRTVDVQAMVGQLQGMIEQVATAATPALKEVAAKAAELAASAAVHAGPIAHRVADKTEQVGRVVASKSRDIASDLRHPRATEGGDGTEGMAEAAPSADEASAAIGDAAESDGGSNPG